MIRNVPSHLALRVALAATLWVSVGSGARAETPTQPLSQQVQEVLAQIVPDPAPPQLVRHSHYVISNEDRPHLFRGSIERVGGALVGVGTDQLYMYASWSRPALIVAMDFDQVVVDVHRIYGVFFGAAETPDDFISWWSPKRESEALELVGKLASSPEDTKALKRAWKHARKAVYARLRRLRFK